MFCAGPREIESLNPLLSEHEAILRERIDYWHGLICSTQALDRDAATDVITTFYRMLGKPRPKVLFFSSPLMCLLAGRALFPVRSQRPAALWRRIKAQLWTQPNEQIWPRIPLDDLDLNGLMDETDGVEDRLWRLALELREPLMYRLRCRAARPVIRRVTGLLEGELAAGGELAAPSAGSPLEELPRELQAWGEDQPGTLSNPFTGELILFERLEDSRLGPPRECLCGCVVASLAGHV